MDILVGSSEGVANGLIIVYSKTFLIFFFFFSSRF